VLVIARYNALPDSERLRARARAITIMQHDTLRSRG
jgi:hypothetical protein